MPWYGLENRQSGNLPILVSPSSKVNFTRANPNPPFCSPYNLLCYSSNPVFFELSGLPFLFTFFMSKPDVPNH